ncbi:MAG: sensor histidine kinase [Chthoniobacterales bacterium]
MKNVARYIAVACFVISVLVLAGWMLNVPFLLRVRPEWVTLRPYGAVTFLLQSSALCFLIDEPRFAARRAPYRVGLACASIAAILGLVATLEYAFRFSLGIDALLFPAQLKGAGTPGRIAPNAAVSHLLMGLALLTIDLRLAWTRVRPSQVLALAVFVINLLAVMGYAYGINELYGGLAIYTKIAFHAALMFLLLPLGTLLARPNHGLMRLVSGDRAGAVIARGLLPAVVILPFVFGWIAVRGSAAQLYDMTFGLMLLAISTIVFFSAIVAWSAHLLNQAQEETTRQAVAVDRLKEERALRETFLSTLTHDLRTPLTAAKLFAQSIAESASGSAEGEYLTHKIVDNIDRADSMIVDLLDANRIKAGERIPLKKSECDIEAVVAQTVEECRQAVGSRLVIDSIGGCTGLWSESAVRRIVENLVSNAVKYGTADTPITVRLRCLDDRARIEVHNFGGELREAEAESLFEIFHRSTQAAVSGQGGWGIGLTLVKGLAEAHGGSVSVESGAGQGTRFIVQLKREIEAAMSHS